jgi:hypothetical protein
LLLLFVVCCCCSLLLVFGCWLLVVVAVAVAVAVAVVVVVAVAVAVAEAEAEAVAVAEAVAEAVAVAVECSRQVASSSRVLSTKNVLDELYSKMYSLGVDSRNVLQKRLLEYIFDRNLLKSQPDKQ